MMNGGLLHTPPALVTDKHKNLFELIELCVDSPKRTDRFQLSDNLLNYLKNIISEEEL